MAHAKPSPLKGKSSPAIAFGVALTTVWGFAAVAIWILRSGDYPARSTDENRNRLAAVYENEIYRRNEASLGPYFRTLYHAIKLIDTQAQLDTQQKRVYANILRSQLSEHAVIALAVNCCSSTLAKGMVPFVVKYHLLKHLPDDQRTALLRDFYPKETFQGRDQPANQSG